MKEFTGSRELLREILSAGKAAGFRKRVLGESVGDGDPVPVVALSRKREGHAPRILLAAGIHGDEPAGPHALLRLLQEGASEWPELSSFHVEIVPLINPTGFDRRTRENVQGLDLNRAFGSPAPPPEIRALMDDYRRRQIDLFLDFHEDVDTPGFYLYELSPENREPFGPHIIAALRERNLPVNTAGKIEGLSAQDGLILRTSRSVPRFFRRGAPQGLYMKKIGTPRTLTFETPPSLPLEQRVLMHLTALRAVLARWSPQRG